jgi:signal transduction histidine kinase
MPVHILILDSQPADAVGRLEELRRAGLELDWRVVRTESEYSAGLDPAPSFVLAAYPRSPVNILVVLQQLRQAGLKIPFFVVARELEEAFATAALQQGAAGFLLEERLASLGPLFTQVLEQKRSPEGKTVQTEAEHAELLEQVRAGRERAQVLSQQLMEAQEAERRHLARELHDEIGQALTAVKINLQALERSAGDNVVLPRLDESVALVDRALQQVRNLSLDLRPSLLDDLGLVAALRWYLDRQAQRAGFAAEFVADPPGIRAPAPLETTCFRVAQEALTNIVRHARAKHVRIGLRQQGNELHLTIRDDGIGFDVPGARQRAARGGSLGLLGMQERVLLIRGRIEIHSASGHGTEIQVRLPLTSALERRSRRRNP